MKRRHFLMLALLLPACAYKSKDDRAFVQRYPIHKVVETSPDQKQRYFSADSGSGEFLGYEPKTNRPIYGSR